MKYKIGDRVRRISETNEPEKWGIKGNVYTVSDIPDSLSIKLEELGRFTADARVFEFVKDDYLPEDLFIL